MRDRHFLRPQARRREVQLALEEIIHFFLPELRLHKGLLEAEQAAAGQLQPLLFGMAGVQAVIHCEGRRGDSPQARGEGRVRGAERVAEAFFDIEVEEDAAELIGAAHPR